MPRIRCHYFNCLLLDDGFCGAPAVELDPDVGCMTFKMSGIQGTDQDWEDIDDDDELEDWDSIDLEEDSDLWSNDL